MNEQRRCAQCLTHDNGWSVVHLLETSGGDFCSRICLERYEDEEGVRLDVISESGTHSPNPETEDETEPMIELRLTGRS